MVVSRRPEKNYNLSQKLVEDSRLFVAFHQLDLCHVHAVVCWLQDSLKLDKNLVVYKWQLRSESRGKILDFVLPLVLDPDG